MYAHVEFLLHCLSCTARGLAVFGVRDSFSGVQLYCISLYQGFLSSSRKPLVLATVGLAIARVIVRVYPKTHMNLENKDTCICAFIHSGVA